MEEKFNTSAEHSGDERHSGEHHRSHSRRHRGHGENLEGKRESWRSPRKKKLLRKRIASAAFLILSILAVILMIFVAYIYIF